MRKEGGREGAYIHNRSRTVAIEVCSSFNFAVVFDFMYFRFRPSKAKSIGNVLMNRQNAANSLRHFLFLIHFVCCVIRRFEIKKLNCALYGQILQSCTWTNREMFICNLDVGEKILQNSTP